MAEYKDDHDEEDDKEKYEWSMRVISYEDFSLDNLDLLQRSNTILYQNMKKRLSDEYHDRLNTLFDSGYITQARYKKYIREIEDDGEDDISIISFYNIVNNEHKKRTQGETLVPIQIESEEQLRELLNNHLKNNNFTMLFYMGEKEDEWNCLYEASALVLKTPEGIKLIRRNNENGTPSVLDIENFLEEETVEDMHVLGIKGRKELKRRFQTPILRLASHIEKQVGYMPRDASKSIFDFANVNREYSPKRKKKSPAKRVRKSPAKRVRKSPAKRVRKSPAKRVRKSPAKRVRKSPVKRVRKSPVKRVRKSPVKRVRKSPVKRN
jgi:glycosidase